MAKQPNKQLSAISHSPSGQSVGVIKSVEMNPNGTSVMAFSLDINSAPIPERKYVPDIATVVCKQGSIRILLAQEKITGGLRNLLIIDLSPRAIYTFLKAVDEVANPSYEEVLVAAKLSVQPLTQIMEEPEQTISLKANIISCCASGSESCVDFYYLSPFAVLKLQSSDKVEVDPVVRVDIHTGLFISLLRQLNKVIVDYPIPEEDKL